MRHAPRRNTAALLLLGCHHEGTAGSAPVRNTYTCGAQLRLPPNFQANLTVGGLPDPPTSLESLGLDFVQRMQPHGGDASAGAMSAIFFNFRRGALDKYWQDGTDPGMFAGGIESMGSTASSTYVGHTFAFVDRETRQRIGTITMRADTTHYMLEPEEGDDETRASAAYLKVVQRQRQRREYFAREGTHWLSADERPKPRLNIWPAEAIGQTHTVVSRHGYWSAPAAVDASAVESGRPVELNLTVLSKPPEGPRLFLIRDLLSEYECDHIVEQGAQVLTDSQVLTLFSFS